MTRMSDLIGVNLDWVQPSSKQEYELRAMDLVVCRLHVLSSFSSKAEVVSSEGCWVFDRPGFWQHKAVVLESESQQELAVFQRHNWRVGGRIIFADGREFQSTSNFWATQYRIMDETENDLVNYVKIGGFFRASCNVMIQPLAETLRDLAWLVPFGWYLALMMKRDAAAAAAAT